MIAVLPGYATQSWKVLEIDLVQVGSTCQTNHEYLLVAVDEAFKFPLAFPLPSKHTEGWADELLK